MNEKEKIIEEMAKDIFNTCAWRFGNPNDYKELCKDIAEDLIKSGYRKIPQGSIVLNAKDIEATCKHCRSKYEKIIEELEEQRDRQAYIAEELIQEKHRWTEQARKETLEKIKLKPIKCGEECGYYYLDISVTGKELLQRVYFNSDFIDGKVRKETAKEIIEIIKEADGADLNYIAEKYGVKVEE